MKLDITRHGEAVELRLTQEDGKVVVWLCDSEQAALYKLANLLFSVPVEEKQAKRSILVGEFVEKDKRPARPDMSEIAKKIQEELKKNGLIPSEEDLSAPMAPAIFPGKPYTVPYFPPNTGGMGSGDMTVGGYPYVGDLPSYGGGIIYKNVCSLGKSLNGGDGQSFLKASMNGFAFTEEPVEVTETGSGANVTYIKVSANT